MEHDAMTSNHKLMNQLLTLPSAMTQYEMPVEVNIAMDHMAAKMEQDRHKEYTNSVAGPFLQLC